MLNIQFKKNKITVYQSRDKYKPHYFAQASEKAKLQMLVTADKFIIFQQYLSLSFAMLLPITLEQNSDDLLHC